MRRHGSYRKRFDGVNPLLLGCEPSPPASNDEDISLLHGEVELVPVPVDDGGAETADLMDPEPISPSVNEPQL